MVYPSIHICSWVHILCATAYREHYNISSGGYNILNALFNLIFLGVLFSFMGKGTFLCKKIVVVRAIKLKTYVTTQAHGFISDHIKNSKFITYSILEWFTARG